MRLCRQQRQEEPGKMTGDSTCFDTPAALPTSAEFTGQYTGADASAAACYMRPPLVALPLANVVLFTTNSLLIRLRGIFSR